jgi:hypothetical protein
MNGCVRYSSTLPTIPIPSTYRYVPVDLQPFVVPWPLFFIFTILYVPGSVRVKALMLQAGRSRIREVVK